MFDRSLYNAEQLIALDAVLDQVNTDCGDISDIDPRIHSAEELEWFALSRGPRTEFGNIEDFIGKPVSYYILEAFCMSRGSSPAYGSIEDLLGKDIPVEILADVSLGRGSNQEYGNVDDLISPTADKDVIWAGLLTRGNDPELPNIDHLLKTNLDGGVMIDISRGLGTSLAYGDISNYPHLDKLKDYHSERLSWGKGNNPEFKDIWDVPELWKLSEDEVRALPRGE